MCLERHGCARPEVPGRGSQHSEGGRPVGGRWRGRKKRCGRQKVIFFPTFAFTAEKFKAGEYGEDQYRRMYIGEPFVLRFCASAISRTASSCKLVQNRL
jgi:hypothetical protein